MNRRTLIVTALVSAIVAVLVTLGAVAYVGDTLVEQSLAGDVTNFSGLAVAAPTAVGTATPAMSVDSNGVSVLFEVRDAATPVAAVNNGGVFDFFSHAPVNLGASGTDFDAQGGLTTANNITVTGSISTTGGLATAGALNMNNQVISNIGNASTDFDTSGGLATANNITVTGAISASAGINLAGGLTVNNGGATVTAGGLTVTAGGATITAGGLDMTNDAITNIGAAGTDFDASGGLATANNITVTGSISVTSAANVANGVDIQGGVLTFPNDESIDGSTAATFDFTRDNAGTVTLTASDDDATAALTVDPGGAAQLTLGSADVTAIVAIADADLQLQNGATGNVDLTFHDYADSADDDMAHALLRTNCTDATTGAEDCDFSISVVEAGAVASARFTIDADGNVSVGGATNDAVVLLPDTDVQIQNQASGNVTLDFRDYADTTDDDMAHVLMTANCTDTGTGAEDCDFTIGVAEAGAAAETRFNIDADAGITIGSSNNTQVQLTAGASSLTYDANDLILTAGQSILPTSGITNTGTIFSAYNTVARTDTSNKAMFVIPANANIIDLWFLVGTASDAGTSAVVDCGTTSGDPDEYVDALDVKVAGLNRMGDASDMPVKDTAGAGAPGDVGASDILVYCKYAEAGTASTTGGPFTLMMSYLID